MLYLAVNGWKKIKQMLMACDGWKLLEIAENEYKCLAVGGYGWKQLEMDENGWKWLEMVGNE